MSEKLEIIGERLGEGGFATTYKARIVDEELLEEVGREIVAMKVPHRYNEKVLKNEIETNASLFVRLRRVSSPNLCQYLTFDTYMSKIVMLMEFVPNNLRNVVGLVHMQNESPGPKLPFEKSIIIITGILKGLEGIHKEGFLHRDIKPENVLLDGDVPKICDLGISTFLSSSSSLARTTAGTWFYMSPEVIDGVGASYSADIWSTGVLFYELLTGVLPFGLGVDTPKGQILDRIRQDEPLPPSHYVDIPSEFDRIVLKALQKNPGHRFPTAGEFLKALSVPQQSPEESLNQTLKDLRLLLDTGTKLTEIENRLEILKEQYPDACELNEFLGEAYIRYQHYHAAIAALEKAIEVNKQNPMCYFNLAVAYERVGNYRKAYWALTRAMRIGLEPELQRHATNWHRLLEQKNEPPALNKQNKGKN